MRNVAVLLSHYNGDRYITEQIDSILNQKLPNNINLELFVRDDGSDQSDLTVLQDYEKKGALTLFRGKNVGVKRSFYQLMSEVSGYDYYFFSDQDDIWVENKVYLMVKELELTNENSNPVGVFSDLFIANENAVSTGKLMKHKTFSGMMKSENFTRINFLKYNMVTGASFAFNESARYSAVQLGENIFDKTNMHDSTMSFLIIFTGQLKYLDTPLVFYRQHGNNVIGFREQESVFKKLKNLQRFFDMKISKLFDTYVISTRVTHFSDRRFLLIEKMFTKNKIKSVILTWQLRDDIFGSRKVFSWLLFIFFGVCSVGKYQKKLKESIENEI